MKMLTRQQDCPYVYDHTPAPSGYLQWHEWARKMMKTHRQIRCSGCSLYTIWEPRLAAGCN